MATSSSVYAYVIERSKADTEFMASVSAMYKRNTAWSNFFIRSVVSILSMFRRPRKHSVRYFFWGHKYEELILGLDRAQICILGGPKQLKFCLRHGIGFIPVMHLWGPLYSGLVNLSFRSSLKGSDTVTRQFCRFSSKRAFFVVDNDSLPMQRTMLAAFNDAGVGKSICIQHGIFQSKTPAHILDGWCADTFFVMDDNQRSVMLNHGMDSQKLRVMGFYKSPYLPSRPLSVGATRKICFFGQPWIRYGGERANKYFEHLSKIQKLSTTLGLEFHYKLHPWEKGLDYVKNIEGQIDCTMDRAIENYDVFISLTSTALLEAAVAGRVAVQIIDSAFECDDFSQFSTVQSIQVESSFFEEHFKMCVAKESGPITPALSPAKRFLTIVEGEK
ncbi:hypothetical protein ACQKO7_04215 [Pseudomonas putida]|uniref:hypothetical protein n=1 Tax=Pseudomonas putida TaxID=303 RepID=UPI003D086D0A